MTETTDIKSGVIAHSLQCYTSVAMVFYLFLCAQKCKLCLKCMKEEEKEMLKGAYLEHINRKSTRRVYPEPMVRAGGSLPEDTP